MEKCNVKPLSQGLPKKLIRPALSAFDSISQLSPQRLPSTLRVWKDAKPWFVQQARGRSILAIENQLKGRMNVIF